MGHSLGADAAIYMAEKMKTLGAPVALVVTFGPTTNLAAPSNVAQVINYHTRSYRSGQDSRVPFPTLISIWLLISII